MEQGGKTLYGATLGILMLETRFPRLPGDVGNAASFPFPVQYRVVRGASPDKVVLDDPRALTERFIEAGQDLVAMGCDGIASTCGFLTPLQQALADALSVPVATSCLMQVPLVQAMLPAQRRVGVITISAESLSMDHLSAARITDPAALPIVGLPPDGAFAGAILENRTSLDVGASRLEMLEAAGRLLEEHADIGAIVLECTNMAPYAADIRKATGLPVFSVIGFLRWFQSGLLPERFQDGVQDPRG